MTKYILKRILIAIPTLLGITIIDYAIMCFCGQSPGNASGSPYFPGSHCCQGGGHGTGQTLFIYSTLSGLGSFFPKHGVLREILRGGQRHDWKPSGTNPPSDGGCR